MKEKGRQKVGGAGREKGRERDPALPSFLPFYFRVCAFSIQRTRLSRSLEQAIPVDERRSKTPLLNPP